MNLEILIPVYIITFSIMTTFFANAHNRNPFLWLVIGFFTGVIGYLMLIILEKNAKVQFAGISNLKAEQAGVKNRVLYEPFETGSGCTQVKSDRNTEKNNLLRFEDDFVTCPNCRILNPIESEKCSVCGKDITG